MLRFAILIAVGAVFLALVTPDLVATIFPDGVQTAGSARSAPPSDKAAAAAPDKANLALSEPAPSGYQQTSILADAGGQYSTDVEIDGQNVKMLVDTGATMVVISAETASRLGLQLANSDYTGRVRTANGIAAVAPVTLREVTIGSIYLGEVKALVADRSAGAVNLLGMSFLKRLAAVEQQSGRLVLRQ
jgi:aspartyl protease family protein